MNTEGWLRFANYVESQINSRDESFLRFNKRKIERLTQKIQDEAKSQDHITSPVKLRRSMARLNKIGNQLKGVTDLKATPVDNAMAWLD